MAAEKEPEEQRIPWQMPATFTENSYLSCTQAI
jgi:hypothetical protein